MKCETNFYGYQLYHGDLTADKTTLIEQRNTKFNPYISILFFTLLLRFFMSAFSMKIIFESKKKKKYFTEFHVFKCVSVLKKSLFEISK